MNADKFFARRLSPVLLVILLTATAAWAQTTAFTFQGRFTDSSVQQPTNGNYNMTFRLYDAPTGGNQIPNGSAAVSALVSVTNNTFTARLDFGAAAFNTAQARYLEIQVGSTFLAPRQEITSTPFAQRAVNAANAEALGGVAANQFVQTNDARLSDSRAPTAGSSNYVQNTTTQQTANFKISGNGTVGGTLTANQVTVNGVLARGGAPGGFGNNNNGYAFNGNGGDNDSGLFSDANGRVSLYADNTERVRVDGSGLNVTGNLTVSGTFSGTLADNSVGGAQVTDGSLRLADITTLNSTINLTSYTLGAHSCLAVTLYLPLGTSATAIGDILTVYLSNSTPRGFYVQPTITTSLTTNYFYICNTLNTDNNLPAQTVRFTFTRP